MDKISIPPLLKLRHTHLYGSTSYQELVWSSHFQLSELWVLWDHFGSYKTASMRVFKPWSLKYLQRFPASTTRQIAICNINCCDEGLQRWREQLTQAVKELVRGQRIFHCGSNIVDKLMLQVYLFIVWNFKYSHLEMQSNRLEVFFSLGTYWLSILEQSSWSLYAAASK